MVGIYTSLLRRSSEFTSPLATQFNPQVHLCFTDVSFTSEGYLMLHLKSLTLTVKAARSWLHHLAILSVWCEPSGSTSHCVQSVVYPPLRLPVWGLPHQSQGYLNPSYSPWTSQHSYWALCISQLQDRRCYYRSRSWSATLADLNAGTLVKQLLQPLYPNSIFYPSEGSWDAGHIAPIRTAGMDLATRT